MAVRSSILALSLFLAACGGKTSTTPPELGLPAWDGDQIVCNENVSFAREATAGLPEFDEDERLGLCARAMRYIELNRQFGDKTGYFGVAAATTASLAATYAPMVRRAYSESTWAFMAALNGDMEAQVNAAAEKATQGGSLIQLFSGAELSTDSLIREEQQAIQARLDAFASSDPEGYARLIEEVNGTFNPTNRLLIAAINRNPFFRAYEAGLAQVRERHGGAIDYADLNQRIEIAGVLQALIEGISPQ